MTKTTAAKLAGNARHMEKLDRIQLRPYLAEGRRIRAAAVLAGESVTGYILAAVRARMDAENVPMPAQADAPKE